MLTKLITLPIRTGLELCRTAIDGFWAGYESTLKKQRHKL